MFYQVGENAWRIMLAAAFVPAVPLLIMVWWIPESPRWLMKKDRYQKAFRSFCRLRKAEIQAARDMVSPHPLTLHRVQIADQAVLCPLSDSRGERCVQGYKLLFTIQRYLYRSTTQKGQYRHLDRYDRTTTLWYQYHGRTSINHCI